MTPRTPISKAKIIVASALLLADLIAYYACIYCVRYAPSPNYLLLTAICILGAFSFFLVRDLSFNSTSLLIKTLATIFHSKTVCEICALSRITLGLDGKIDICFLTIGLFNVVRGVLKNSLGVGFNENRKMAYYEDVIKLEKYLMAMSRPHNTVEDVREFMFRNAKCLVNYDTKTVFGMLCDDRETNAMADRVNEIYGLHGMCGAESVEVSPSNGTDSDFVVRIDRPAQVVGTAAADDLLPENHISQLRIGEFFSVRSLPGKISFQSLQRLFSSEAAAEILKLLTQGFDEALSYEEFYENMRQINIERRSFASFLRGNSHILNILSVSTWVLFGLVTIMAVGKILDLNDFMKFLVYPFFMLMFPWFVNLLDSFMFIIYIHPYDIEDKVIIDDESLIVKSIRLSSTVFEKWNNEVVIYPNASLKDKLFKNIRRSKNQQKIVTVMIRRKDVKNLKHIRKWLDELSSGSSAFAGFDLVVDRIVDCNFVRVDFMIRHSINHQNGYFMWVVQNRFMKSLTGLLREHRVRYRPLEIPVEIERVSSPD